MPASPADAVRSTSISILLIHGGRDTNILPRHWQELQLLNPRAATLWAVPYAEHVQCLTTAGDDYRQRVLAWFR